MSPPSSRVTTTTTTTTKASTSASAPSSESESEPASAPASESESESASASASIIRKGVTPTTTNSNIIRSLSILDPVLQFLTRASGQTLIPFQNLKKTIPSLSKAVPYKDFVHLIKFGILIIQTQTSAAAVQQTSSQSQQKISTDDNDNDFEQEKEHQSQEEYISSLSNSSNWEDEFESRWYDATNSTGDDGLSSSSGGGGGVSSSESGTCLFHFHIGFPSGDTNKKLCGSTKTAAKRRCTVK